MKIIATISDSQFMCQIDRDELALLLGHRSAYEIRGRTITIGEELPLTKMARTSEFVRTMDKEKLLKIKAQLQEAIANVDDAANVVEALSTFEILKEEHK
jgi:hypothetical protein